jgi:hypothetical protein
MRGIATGFGPLVVLLSEHRATSRLMAGRSGKVSTTSVRRRSSLEPFLWIERPHLAQIPRGTAVRVGMSSRTAEMLGGGGQLGFQCLHDPAELGVHVGGVGLVEDGAGQGGDPGLPGTTEFRY